MPDHKLVSDAQDRALLDFVQENPGLALGRVSAQAAPLAKLQAQEAWESLASRLNAMGSGTTKSAVKWKDTASSTSQSPALLPQRHTPPTERIVVFLNSSTRTMNMYKFGNKSGYDFDKGLKVLMRLDETDDFYYSIPLRGAKLQFSDAYDFPDAPSGSFAMQVINPAVHMTVDMAATSTEAARDIQHIDLKLRRCLFYDESPYLTFYTHSDCILKCRMLFLVQKCNCAPFNIPKMDHVRTCDMRDVECLRKVYVQSITVRPDIEPIAPELEIEMAGGGIACPMCYPTCSKTAYSFDFYNVKIYPDRLNTVPDSLRENWLQGADFTGTSIVHVKHRREVADCYGQNVIMKWFDLFSNIGSTCGFVTGFSFVSILEFVYFYTIKLFRNINSQRRQNRVVKPTEEREIRHIHPVGRYRPIYWNELAGPTAFGQHIPIE